MYVSNVSDQMVYFDNLQVTNNRGQIMEENHCYGYGLKIASISSHKLPDPNEGQTGNNNLYNDKELIDDADLDWYDYGFRSYDPQIGRFPQLDPLTNDYPELTPYQYASDDPVTNIDVDGLEGVNGVKPIKEFIVSGHKAAAQATNLTGKVLTLSAIKLAVVVVKSQILTNSLKEGLSTKAVQDNLSLGAETFYDMNRSQMSYSDYLKFGAEVNTYFKGLNLMAWWRKNHFVKLDRSVINNDGGNLSDHLIINLTQGRINEIAAEVPKMLSRHVEIPLALGYAALDPFVGVRPKGTNLKFTTLPPLPKPLTLEGAVLNNYTRFVKSIPANSKSNSTFQQLEDGNYLFKAISPGRVPGSSALYQKWVNPQGETFKLFKITFGPDGSIIHIKSKL